MQWLASMPSAVQVHMTVHTCMYTVHCTLYTVLLIDTQSLTCPISMAGLRLSPTSMTRSLRRMVKSPVRVSTSTSLALAPNEKYEYMFPLPVFQSNQRSGDA